MRIQWRRRVPSPSGASSKRHVAAGFSDPPTAHENSRGQSQATISDVVTGDDGARPVWVLDDADAPCRCAGVVIGDRLADDGGIFLAGSDDQPGGHVGLDCGGDVS